jgi:membrane associated rhomboid family serine protease
MGHRRYFIFYLLVGLVASATQISLNPTSKIPLIGASGAIAGVLGAYFVLYPKAKIMAVVPIWIFLRFIEVPAVLFLGFWFILQAFQSWGSLLQAAQGTKDIGGVAWMAHAGGFLSGLIFVFLFRKSAKR